MKVRSGTTSESILDSGTKVMRTHESYLLTFEMVRKLYIPSVVDGNNAAGVQGDWCKHWLWKIKMLLGRIAPSARTAGWTEVGGGYSDWASPRNAPPRLSAGYLVTGSTLSAAIKKGHTEGGRFNPVPAVVQISVTTSTACKTKNKKQKHSPIKYNLHRPEKWSLDFNSKI